MAVPAQIPVKDANGNTVNANAPLNPGRASAAESRPVAFSTEDLAAINALGTLLTAISSNTDGLEGFTDGVEALIGSSNTKLDTLATALTTLQGYVDQLEGFVDGLEALTGAVTETAPASDTASSGLNGRLQRLAQRITTLNTNVGSIGDAVLTTGNSGSLLAMIRTMMEQLLSTAAAAVKIDQTTDGTTNLVRAVVRNPNYETVAASQTDQVMGASGAAGDILSQVLIIPATTSPGAVSIKDGAGSAITIFTGGASSVTTLIPFAVPLGIVAGTNWKITTGANVSAIGIGKFS